MQNGNTNLIAERMNNNMQMLNANIVARNAHYL